MTPVTISPLKITFPPPSLISMLCGIAASSLTKSRSNGLFAGAWNVLSTNWMSLACTVGVAPATGGGGGAPDPPGAPDAPGEASSPEARGGIQPTWTTNAATSMIARPDSRSFGVRGSGMFSRWPVVSASTVFSNSARAAPIHPASVRISAMTPAARIQPPKTRPRNSNPAPRAARNGRKDGPGMCTPGGGPVWVTSGSSGTVDPRSWS